jgi:hypothetical protein
MEERGGGAGMDDTLLVVGFGQASGLLVEGA